jgi:prepilin-type N-terminal cleavage/methylation domain-containing protein/prepilin-type processing-associated H-X9-DG protein
MKKKGFTLVELLVVIAIIALLMGILMPALARVRMIAYRMICGTNLAGIGKAIVLYSGDMRESYPMTGCSNTTRWSQTGRIIYWYDAGVPITSVFNCTTNLPGGEATIGSIFYMLVRFEDTSVKQFNCKGDVGIRTFRLTDYVAGKNPVEDFTKCYDFGLGTGRFYSYAYQQPFYPDVAGCAQYQINANTPPNAALAADRNPTLDTNVNYITRGSQPGGDATETDAVTPCDTWASNSNSYADRDNVYNSFAHQREGQNVLFNDGHVGFMKTANVGIDNDNIWQQWPQGPYPNNQPKPDKQTREACGWFIQKGTGGQVYQSADQVYSRAVGDSLLVNEPQDSGQAPISGGG